MPQAAPKAVGTPKSGEVKEVVAKAEKKPSAPRTKFSKMWPEDAKITLLVTENVKKKGSKAAERFQHYFASKTVGDYLAAGGTYQDIAYDSGRQFVKIG